MASMPTHEETRSFSRELAALTGYIVTAEHSPSRVVLLCRDEESKRNRMIDFSKVRIVETARSPVA